MPYDRLAALTLQHLRVFAAVARERSFTRAADILCLSQPTVSTQIRVLEQIIGARLLERSPGRRPVELTEVGRLLLDAAEEISAALQRAMGTIDLQHQHGQSMLSFGADVYFGGYLLPKVYDAFRRSHPRITVRCEVDFEWRLLEHLLHDQMDLAVMVSPSDDPHLIAEPYLQFDMVLIGPAGHRLAGITPAPFSELSREQMILPERTTAIRRILEDKAMQKDTAIDVILEVNNIDTQMQAVAGGLGIAVTCVYVPATAMSDQFAVLNVEDFPVTLEWTLVHSRGKLTYAAQEFRKHLFMCRPQFADKLR